MPIFFWILSFQRFGNVSTYATMFRYLNINLVMNSSRFRFRTTIIGRFPHFHGQFHSWTIRTHDFLSPIWTFTLSLYSLNILWYRTSILQCIFLFNILGAPIFNSHLIKLYILFKSFVSLHYFYYSIWITSIFNQNST